MEHTNHKLTKTFFNVSSVLVLIFSLALAIIWLFFPDINFNFEPALGLLGLLYAAIPLLGNFIIKRLDNNLKKERLTLPYALAYGYFTNYLVPVVSSLRSSSKNPNELKFYVYIPNSLEEFHDYGINSIISELKNNHYEIDKVELKLDTQKRSKDYRTAKHLTNQGQHLKYFDFPTTLLTLEQAVDYKLSSQSGTFTSDVKKNIASEFINEFKQKLELLLSDDLYESIRSNIIITNKKLIF